jgi:ketosteroid isomerase-like protein
MAHANEELLRKGFEAFGAGDMTTLDALFADDAVWHASGSGVVSGDFVGKAAVFGSFALIPQETDGFSQVIHAILADDDHAVALVNATATRRGTTATLAQVFVFHIESGKVKEVWLTPFDQAAADEFWSA